MATFFRTIELSDPAYEQDGLRYMTVKTSNLSGRGDLTIWIPELDRRKTKPLPLVILLHGVYGSHWAWTLKGGAHRTAQRLIREGQLRPMILAMPSDGLWGDGSGYVPHNGYNFDQWIVEDVPKAVLAALHPDQSIHLLERPFITGLSMGGFGALRLAAKYPERFRAAHGLSSITHINQLPLFVEEPLSTYRQLNATDESVLDLMIQNRAKLPPIQFDCGTDDLLIEPNRALHRALTEQQIPHHYQEHPGSHEWTYWQQHLADALLFFNSTLA